MFVPGLRQVKLLGLGDDDRLRYSVVTMANRAPAEQELEHLVGAAGEPAFSTGGAPTVGGFGPLRFWRTDNLWVHLAGTWQVTIAAGGAPAQTAFFLPGGYRPPFEQFEEIFPAAFGVSPFTRATAFGSAVVRIVAESRFGAGAVNITTSGAAGTYIVSLDGISFRSI